MEEIKTYREVHTAELVHKGFHPWFILFVDRLVYLKQQTCYKDVAGCSLQD